MIEPVAQPDLAEHILGLGVALRRQAQRDKRQQDVVDGRQVVDQVELLEHEADLLAAERVLLDLVHRGDGLAGDLDRSRGRPVESAQEVKQRALARPRRPDEKRAGARRNLERNAPQRLDDLRRRSRNDLRTSDTRIIAVADRGQSTRASWFQEASLRMASMGVMREARQAGYNPASVAITIAVKMLAATSSAVRSSLSSKRVSR